MPCSLFFIKTCASSDKNLPGTALRLHIQGLHTGQTHLSQGSRITAMEGAVTTRLALHKAARPLCDSVARDAQAAWS